MSDNHKKNNKGKQVAVVVGATSKWQSDGRNTLLAHGRALDDSDLPLACAGGSEAPLLRSSRKKIFSSDRQPESRPMRRRWRRRSGSRVETV